MAVDFLVVTCLHNLEYLIRTDTIPMKYIDALGEGFFNFQRVYLCGIIEPSIVLWFTLDDEDLENAELRRKRLDCEGSGLQQQTPDDAEPDERRNYILSNKIVSKG